MNDGASGLPQSRPRQRVRGMGLRGRKLRGARGAGIRLPRMAFGITIVVRPFLIHGLLLSRQPSTR